MKQFNFTHILLLSLLVLIASSLIVNAQDCYPTGQVTGTRPPNDQCNRENDSQCCEEGKPYDIYRCSPSVSGQTKATLTINSFQEGGDGGGASACDGNFHDDNTPVVALSTGWFDGRSRCLKFININGNGRSVRAQVVDECDSTTGCDEEHSYQPPCRNNIVDASRAVWNALGLDENDDRWGYMDVTWSDA